MTLTEAFSIGERESIGLVGGGGKTTLMYALGRELSACRSGIILTTTTKIMEPPPSPSLLKFLSNNLRDIKGWLAENMHLRKSLLVAGKRLPGGKLEGLPPEWVDQIFSIEGINAVINEADGSAGRPLKAPRAGEPVIPGNTTLLVPVVGIEGMGSALSEEVVFRSAIASSLLNLPMGSVVTEDVIAKLMMELIKGGPAGARIVPLINKVDTPDGQKKARNLARHLLSADHDRRIRRVVFGQLLPFPDVKIYKN